MFAIIVCAAILAMIGYFAVLCSAEFAWWLRDRVQSDQYQTTHNSSISRRQIVIR